MNLDSKEGVFSLPGHELSRLDRMLLSCSSGIASPMIFSIFLEMFSEIAQSTRTGSAAAAVLSAQAALQQQYSVRTSSSTLCIEAALPPQRSGSHSRQQWQGPGSGSSVSSSSSAIQPDIGSCSGCVWLYIVSAALLECCLSVCVCCVTVLPECPLSPGTASDIAAAVSAVRRNGDA